MISLVLWLFHELCAQAVFSHFKENVGSLRVYICVFELSKRKSMLYECCIIVMDGPWIVQKAVGPGTPAMLGKDLPLQYFFSEPTNTKKGVYEVAIHVASSRIARGILNVVKGHIKTLTLAFAFIIEASEEADLPEQVLATFQVHSLHIDDCPNLPVVRDVNLSS